MPVIPGTAASSGTRSAGSVAAKPETSGSGWGGVKAVDDAGRATSGCDELADAVPAPTASVPATRAATVTGNRR
jgi:hypothetical protein